MKVVQQDVRPPGRWRDVINASISALVLGLTIGFLAAIVYLGNHPPASHDDSHIACYVDGHAHASNYGDSAPQSEVWIASLFLSITLDFSEFTFAQAKLGGKFLKQGGSKYDADWDETSCGI